MPLGHDLIHALDELRAATRPTLVLAGNDAGERVSMLAGSFDPLTIAHAALAGEAADRSDLVVLVYSVRTIPKEGRVPAPLLSESVRLAVLERFCTARPGLAVGVASHGLLTEQVAAARDRFPGAGLSLVMGSDKALQLLDPKWYADRDHELDALFAQASVLYAVRSGDERAVEEVLKRPENTRWVERFVRLAVAPDIGVVSARRVRELVLHGEPFEHLVPAEAADAVRKAVRR